MAVYSDEWKCHLNHLDTFFKLIKEAGLTLNYKEVVLAKLEVKYVGQYVGSGKKKPNPDKLEVIKTLVRPTTHVIVSYSN